MEAQAQAHAAQAAPAEPVLVREDSGKDGSVATLRLNRPRQFNALSEELLAALQREVDLIAKQPEVHCVVIAASGKAFCAGHDLKQMRSHTDEAYFTELFTRCGRVMQSLQALPVPVIARVHGIATAAGCQLVASCDMAIAASSATFAVSGINAGLFCSTPSVALSRNVSTKRAFNMLVTGRFIDAATAADWGLINEAVPDAELDAAIAKLVGTITAKSPAAIRHGKAAFYRQQKLPLADAYQLATGVMVDNMMESDAGEGIDAFMEKRPPVWGS